jgi:hypothetical protein
MTTRSLTRLAAASIVTGVAGIALATPAAAMVDPAPPPNGNGSSLSESPTSTATDDSPWAEIGVAVVGGVALAGVGIAAGSAVRRRSLAHTA